MSLQPRASERSERHPGLGRMRSDTPPEGAKAAAGAILSVNLDAASPHLNAPISHLNAPISHLDTPISHLNAPCATI